MGAPAFSFAVGMVTNGLVNIGLGLHELVGALNAQSSGGGSGVSQGPAAPQGPPPNGGSAKPHGGSAHNKAVDKAIEKLKQDPGVSNIRKNQQQVNVQGKKVGNNRPDIQYDKGGCHHCVEFDRIPSNGQHHGQVIKQNDPNTNIDLKLP